MIEPKQVANILIEEVTPRLKKGGVMPEPRDLVFLLTLKNIQKISHNQFRQWLDKVMFSRND